MNHCRFAPVGALFAAVALLVAPPALRADEMAAPSPMWHVKDLDGQEIGAAALKGKVVIVDFWATWCGPCRREIPGYVELQKKYGPQGLVIVGISLDQGGVDGVRAFVKKYEVSYPIAMADDAVIGAFSAFGGMDAIPTTFLIDRDGIVRDRKVGAVPSEEYEKTILRYLKAAQASTSR